MHTIQWLNRLLTFFYNSSKHGKWPLLKIKLLESPLCRVRICFPEIFTLWNVVQPTGVIKNKQAVIGTRGFSSSVISSFYHLLSCYVLWGSPLQELPPCHSPLNAFVYFCFFGCGPKTPERILTARRSTRSALRKNPYHKVLRWWF